MAVSEAAQIGIGIPVAVLFPLGVPRLNQHRFLCATATLVHAALVLLPVLHGWPAWVVLGATPLAALLARRLLRGAIPGVDDPVLPPGNRGIPVRLVGRVLAALVLVLAVTLVPVVSVTGWDWLRTLWRVLTDGPLTTVTTGALTAMFVGDLVLYVVVKPYLRRLSDDELAGGRLNQTGANIGWIERAVFFSFVASGQPEAAALALAAKSVVRLPTLREGEERFTNYVITGSMVSILVALLAAIITRLTLGLSPI
jgi:hypothetical protein